MTFSRLALVAASFALLTAAAAAEPTTYPLTLENCGETLTFQKAPASTVTNRWWCLNDKNCPIRGW
ncbi:hypothetical protein GCM10010869_06690 [Mesorhizobium tianshanense]|uniref:Iron complex transport system substrate-binding protein n=1 Tax=Mesorhizobium tianshanense TaxID=39844 RepID=A0A562MAK5_9HYPH|nr:hypothetical protein [Mesorhizobium tianshanense]TWI16955.1 iron complex transport system substrate-binding protein [Mesorhizobium tianshanense]GLS35081.1 hypothetical protein GCM10010869_06690 [Mesorhizobium tianshanense]